MHIQQTHRTHLGGRGRRDARGTACDPRPGTERTPLHSARRSRIARSRVDYGRHHAQPRQHDLRPAVRLDADFQPHPQMVDGHRIDSDGLTWELTLRDGPRFP